MDMEEAAAVTLVDLAVQRAQDQPEQLVYTYLEDGGLEDGESQETTLTRQQLDRAARAIASRVEASARPGDRVMLLYPPGLDFVSGFFGCLYGGFVAVPVYPPDFTNLERSLEKLRGILRDSQPTVLLTNAMVMTLARGLLSTEPEFSRLEWIATDEVPAERGLDWAPPRWPGSNVAFLQYTSGSTGTPRGVMVTHDNLMANERLIQTMMELDESLVCVSWLPLYHDMGLIGNVLQPVFVGGRTVLLSPLAFLQKPERWLRALERYGGTASGAPTFGYLLAQRKLSPDLLESLDLSKWSLAAIAAEPVRMEAVEAFEATFAPCGFPASSFYPCYGLAETTLMITGGSREAPAQFLHLERESLGHGLVRVAPEPGADTVALANCGRTGPGHEVRIVDPTTCIECPEGTVGEVWCAGPSIAAGYWGRPEESERLFRAHIEGSDSGPWLRTGDLGFLWEGDLYISGRLKDLIILRGQNWYPQDIEASVERAHPAIRSGCSAAFSVETPEGECVTVVAEVKKGQADLETLSGAIRATVAREVGLHVRDVALLKPKQILKTSSGKIARRPTREALLAGRLKVLHRDQVEEPPVASPPPTSHLLLRTLAALTDSASRRTVLRLNLQERIATVMGVPVDQLDPDKPLVDQVPFDSLLAAELGAALEAELGPIPLTLRVLLDGASLASLAELLDNHPAQRKYRAPGADAPASGESGAL